MFKDFYKLEAASVCTAAMHVVWSVAASSGGGPAGVAYIAALQTHWRDWSIRNAGHRLLRIVVAIQHGASVEKGPEASIKLADFG